MGRYVPASQSLDRRSEEMFGFDVQVEKPMFKNAGKVCPDGGLADAADTSEEYTHAESSMRVVPLLAIISDSCRTGIRMSTGEW